MKQGRKNLQMRTILSIQKICAECLHPVTLVMIGAILLSTLLIAAEETHTILMAIANLLAGVGGSLLADRIQKWKR